MRLFIHISERGDILVVHLAHKGRNAEIEIAHIDPLEVELGVVVEELMILQPTEVADLHF